MVYTCASERPPQVAPTATARPAPAAQPAQDAATPTAADAGAVTNDCHVEEEFARFAQWSDVDPDARAQWAHDHAARLLPSDEAERAVGDVARAILGALVREDFAALAQLVPPGRGVCLRASKGADCRWMSREQVRACPASHRREPWSVDTGADELPRLTCLQAVRRIFLGNPGLADASPSFNCFVPRADNNAASLIVPDAPEGIYVEFFADEDEGSEPARYRPWRSLWLTFAKEDETWSLAAITSHYWGI